PQIGRITDVSWENEKMIFEIQCSPISLKEAKERCSDYKRLGLNVIWILHDRQFNKKTVGEAEAFLRTQACYFVSDREIFYDQFDIVQGVRRLFKGPPLPIDLMRYFPQKDPEAQHPKVLHFRAKHHPLYFQGDLSDNLFRSKDFALLKRLEKRYAASRSLPWVAAIKKLYGGLLRLLLDLDS
ncbi:MAG TPA: competence protein CoiA family protein, partial [Rhabdochlamydiaceae bacterium]